MDDLPVSGYQTPDFETKQAIDFISLRIQSLLPVKEWKDLARASQLLKNISMDAFLGAMAGMVLFPEDNYSKGLWKERERLQVLDCVRMGAELFARREANGEPHPAFSSQEGCVPSLEEAYASGKHLHNFCTQARLVMSTSLYLDDPHTQKAGEILPEFQEVTGCLRTAMYGASDELMDSVALMTTSSPWIKISDVQATVCREFEGLPVRNLQQQIAAASNLLPPKP